MARVNVELKARRDDLEATAARCLALGASDQGVLEQRDTYYPAPRGRLKLRDQGETGAELIPYGRADEFEPSESTYVLAPVAETGPMAEALEYALGPPTVVVAKRRHLLLREGVRIHLDEVEGLGTFIELEAVVTSGSGEEAVAAAREKVAHLRHELGIQDSDLVAGGYADLLLDVPQALLRAADAAMRHAYAPYSQFRVGAALRGASGAIYAAANVENAAYPQSQCAEASALGVMVAAGEIALTAVAVVCEQPEHCSPCGGCRQRLSEFGRPDTPVYMGRPGESPRTTTLGELLPGWFGREALEA
jgi:homotetrameric cytidine deaminase